MTAWPGSLPRAPLLGTFAATPQEVRGQSDIATGEQKRRERTISAGMDVVMSLNMTAAQRTTFAAFYDTTLNNGTGSFTMAHPIDGVEKTWVFAQPPITQHIAAELYRVNLTLFQEA